MKKQNQKNSLTLDEIIFVAADEFDGKNADKYELKLCTHCKKGCYLVSMVADEQHNYKCNFCKRQP